MSAKTTLSREELKAIFPSLRKLAVDCWGQDRAKWGMCQHLDRMTEISFRLPDGKWKLVCSLESFIKTSEEKLGSPDFEDVIVYYEVEVVLPFGIESHIFNLKEVEELKMEAGVPSHCLSKSKRMIS